MYTFALFVLNLRIAHECFDLLSYAVQARDEEIYKPLEQPGFGFLKSQGGTRASKTFPKESP